MNREEIIAKLQNLVAQLQQYIRDNYPSQVVKETMQQLCIRVCTEEGLGDYSVVGTDAWKMYKTVHCESNFNARIVHPNILKGVVTSTDYGICQINDYFHIGPGKDFPSKDYVLDNPEACLRWMARQFKSGENAKRMWVCYSKGMYLHY